MFFGESRGRGRGAHAARVGPAHHRPADHPRRRSAVVAGFANLPDTGVLSWVPESFALRFEHYVEPTGGLLPRRASTRPSTTPSSRCGSRSSRPPSALVGAGLAYLWFWKGIGPHGLTERQRVARAGYTVLENKYYLDHLYTDVIAGGIKGPIAQAAYWFNQNVIDGIVNGVGAASVAARPVGLQVHRPGRRRQHRQRLGRDAPRARGSSCASSQTGKVQPYGAFLFAGATILAGVFVLIVSALRTMRRGRQHRGQTCSTTGGSPPSSSCPWSGRR